MEIEKLKSREDLLQDKKYNKAYTKMQNLITAINKKGISDEFIVVINDDVRKLNSFVGTEKQLIRFIKKTTSKTAKFVEAKLKLVSKYHYRNYGLIMGMLFGPILTQSIDGLGFGGLGMVLGMAVGIAIGISYDTKAAKEGRQLDVDNIEF